MEESSMRRTSWIWHDRATLSYMLKEGYKLTEIAEMLQCSLTKLREEIKRGLDSEANENQRFVKYDPIKALFVEFEDRFDEESIEVMQNLLCITLPHFFTPLLQKKKRKSKERKKGNMNTKYPLKMFFLLHEDS